MDYTGFNMSRIKNANRASVLYLLNSRKSMSRKDIAGSLGLTPAAVSKICAELIAEGAVSECGLSDGAGAGRKKIILSLNSSKFAVLAVSIDAGGFYCGICTLGGEEITGEYTALPKDTEPEDFLRAVGENPATSDAAGINVGRYKYVSTIVGSIIAGLGGLYYVMDYANGVWSNNGFGDRGWLAIALVIFAVWKPDLGILGSFLFGGLMVVHNYIPNLSFGAQELFMMTPYVVTIIVLVAVSMRRKRENLPPASLGLSYFREDR